MLNNYKSRLILIATLCGVACFYLLPSYSKYIKDSNYDVIFTSPEKTVSIPAGNGVLLSFNDSVDRDCLSNFEFYTNYKNKDEHSDNIEDLLINNSSDDLNLELNDLSEEKTLKNLTIDWSDTPIDKNNEIKCLSNPEVCLAISNENLYYNSLIDISKIKFSHDGCVSKVSGKLLSEYNFIASPINNEEINDGAILLGLDLQGGMYIQLELDIPALVEKSSTKLTDELKEIIQLANENSIKNNLDFFDAFSDLCDSKNIRLSHHYMEYRKSKNEEIIQILRNNRDSALQGAIKILRERIDKLGVSEPIIQKFGASRIVVELAGIQDKNRTRKLIKRIASLELSLVLNERLPNALKSINNYFESMNLGENYFSLYSDPDLMGSRGILEVHKEKIPEVELLLSKVHSTGNVALGGRFVWSNQIESISLADGETVEYKELYFISNNPVIVGGMIESSEADIAPPGSENSGQWVINLDMTREGAKKWSRFTGANIGKRVAIVLDDKVFMAPVINGKIPSGTTTISGRLTAEEANDIANVLSAGELAAPMKIVLERSVSPSLGKDSIESGKNALVIAFISIVIFILFYYRMSGIIANIALFLNIIFILAILSIIEATLTLPGIAGLILTIGIAIDSNVIIFERIKEELKLGKNSLAAVKSGYKRAIITIMDANITTLIAAFVLANIGSGPIKGFAITLSIGILCSMFTAIFVTKTFYMIMLRGGDKKISI